ncbi:ABC transporter permease (plasmid) [Haloterrigena salifodinae]|uniref:ABC transporter permease n=1 Tax=Haloterrigena salifodinae TaxID=2675099 RepID=A0A8T8E672_9EURY|nr:ABC transporter permease [Haloterrigena salifodinae]QRV17384.1 ABC transporter permease [Haloterrigena salifodinae]
MNNYYVKRTGRAVLTLWVTVTLTFGLIRAIPGGPLEMLRARLVRQGVDPARIDSIIQSRQQQSQPIYVEYYEYMSSLLSGNLGESFYFREPVSKIITDALPWTVFIMVTATIILFAIAVVWGALIAYKEGSRFDTVSSGMAILLSSIPFYVLGILFVVVFSYKFGVFPARYRTSPGVSPSLSITFVGNALYHAALPIASIVITQVGLQTLAMRGNSIQVLGEDFVRVARLRGLSDRRIAVRYVGRNAILPMYTGFLTLIGFNLGGSVILEEIFTYTGIGYYMFEALINRDYPLMMGIFLVITTALVVSVYIADLTYGLVDPRVKSGDSSETY